MQNIQDYVCYGEYTYTYITQETILLVIIIYDNYHTFHV